MEPGVFALFVFADQHEPDSVRLCLGKMQVDDAWLRISELECGGRKLLMLEIFDLDTGGPVDVPGLGQELSAEGRSAFLVAVDPTDQGTAFECFEDGEERFAWGGAWNSFPVEGQDTQQAQEGGRGRFLARFSELTGLDWAELATTAAAVPRFDQVADGRTELLLRGRLIGIPEGTPRQAELFRLHYADDGFEEEEDLEDEEDEEEGGHGLGEEDDEGRLMLLLLDQRLASFLWEEAPAAHVAAFLKAVESVRAAVLGPLAHALPDVIGMVQAQPPDRPLASSPLRELLVYEVLSMATAVAFTAGDTVGYYDRLFFPLLHLSNDPVVPEAVSASLEEIRDLDILNAMVEVLPYSVPEGELLECFGDDELTPLASWAAEDGVYEGSLFLLDADRLGSCVAELDGEQLMARVEQFRAVWADLLPPGNQWHAGEEELDRYELERFAERLGELRLLLALSEANQLQPAIFFYD